MIFKERLLKIIRAPHISEKTSTLMKKHNMIVLKVDKNSNKTEIKFALMKLFKVKVKNICTLIIKGKSKRHGKYFGHRKDWKKAYISLEKGQKIDLINIKE